MGTSEIEGFPCVDRVYLFSLEAQLQRLVVDSEVREFADVTLITVLRRVLKDLELDDWAAEYNVTDEMLCVAAQEIEAGLVDARLGGFLLKKRVAAPGRGKQGSYRTIVGHRQSDRLIFVHGFAKN